MDRDRLPRMTMEDLLLELKRLRREIEELKSEYEKLNRLHMQKINELRREVRNVEKTNVAKQKVKEAKKRN